MLSKELVLTELLYEAVIQLWKQEGWCAGPQTLVLGSLEKLGELAAEILVTECFDFTPSHHKPNVQECRDNIPYEIGDILTYLMELCYVLGIRPKFKWLGEVLILDEQLDKELIE